MLYVRIKSGLLYQRLSNGLLRFRRPKPSERLFLAYNRNSGFSLVELMITIALIGIITILFFVSIFVIMALCSAIWN